jgi:hypothetical protein
MLDFLHHQGDLLFERQGIGRTARQGERVLMSKDRGDSASDGTQKHPSEHVLAIYGRPQLSKINTYDAVKYIGACLDIL